MSDDPILAREWEHDHECGCVVIEDNEILDADAACDEHNRVVAELWRVGVELERVRARLAAVERVVSCARIVARNHFAAPSLADRAIARQDVIDLAYAVRALGAPVGDGGHE